MVGQERVESRLGVANGISSLEIDEKKRRVRVYLETFDYVKLREPDLILSNWGVQLIINNNQGFDLT